MSSLLEDASLWTWIVLTMVFGVYRGASHQRNAQLVGVRTRLTEDNAKTLLTGVMPAVAGGFLAGAEGCGTSRDSRTETGGAGGASGSDVGAGDCSGALCTSGSFCIQNGDGA
jgi:hypothetical protein